MSDEREMSDLREAQAGREARRALDIVGGHLDTLRTRCLSEAVRSAPDAHDLRERMIVSCQVIDAMRHVLELSVASGAAADVRMLMARDGVI